MSEGREVQGTNGGGRAAPGPHADRGARDPEDGERLLADAPLDAPELAAIFAAHADGLVIYGRAGEIRAMNPAAREMFGVRDTPAASYRELTAALAPLDAAGAPLDLDALPSRRAMRGEHVRGFVMAVHTSRGLVWYSASAAPLWTADGAIAGAVLSCVDITHLRRLEEDCDELTRALTHDARTRLNVIQTHAELLGHADVGEETVRRRATVIEASARRLSELIDALVEGR